MKHSLKQPRNTSFVIHSLLLSLLLLTLVTAGCTNPLWKNITSSPTASFCTALVDQYHYDLMIIRDDSFSGKMKQTIAILQPKQSVDDILSDIVQKSESVDEVIAWLNAQECVKKARPLREILGNAPITEVHVAFIKGLPIEPHAMFIRTSNKDGILRYEEMAFFIE